MKVFSFLCLAIASLVQANEVVEVLSEVSSHSLCC